MTITYDRAAIRVELADEGIEADQITTINRWLARGDGIAVYRNEDLSSRQCGHRQFVSFGSTDAQIETNHPPIKLPDIGNAINWRYCLVGTYRGETL